MAIERVKREPITGVWGQSLQRGPETEPRAPGGGQGTKPPEVESFSSIFIQKAAKI